MVRLATLITVLCLLAGPLLAQTSTGRHRRAAADEAVPAVETATDGGRLWFVTFGAGLATSGDLIRVRTANGGDQTWSPPGGQPFSSADYVLTLDESIGLAVTVGRRLGSRFSIRLDLSAAELPISALARVGETAEVYRWDELAVLIVGLGAEYRLVRTPSYAYLLAGGALTRVSGSGSDAFDQSRLGFRFGGGFNQRLGGDWGLRLEIRDTVQSLDFDGYRPPVPVGAPYPGVQLEDMGPQHLVEASLALRGAF